jgi:hypothetical protein
MKEEKPRNDNEPFNFDASRKFAIGVLVALIVGLLVGFGWTLSVMGAPVWLSIVGGFGLAALAGGLVYILANK